MKKRNLATFAVLLAMVATGCKPQQTSSSEAPKGNVVYSKSIQAEG